MSIIKIVGGHEVRLPEPPTDKREILFHDAKNDNDAYWRRDLIIRDYRSIWFDFIPDFTKLDQEITRYDQDEQLCSLNAEDSAYIRRIYTQEMDRRANGVHFRNGKSIEYLTGDHYFTLMWARMQRHDDEGDYADFREFQAHFFYLIKHCWQEPNIAGLFISKPKKTGITNLMWDYYLNKATRMKSKNMGAMNIDQALAAKTFLDYFMYAFNGLPHAFRPKVKRQSEKDGAIIFGTPFSKNRKRASQTDGDLELNTSIFCVATKPKAFDIAVMNDAWVDEFPKIVKESPGEIFRTSKQSIKIQKKINGRLWFTSYTPEEDSDSFREARKIFQQSELDTIKPPDLSTQSELINWHIPAYSAWEGCFDIHGRCEEQRAYRENEKERLKVKSDRRSYQSIIRQYANNAKEAWGSAGAGSTYDNMRLSDLIGEVEIEERNSIVPPYREGFLKWTNAMWEGGTFDKRPRGSICPVIFVDLTDQDREKGRRGKFRMYYDIDPYLQNQIVTLGKDDFGCWNAPLRHSFVMGADPTNYAAGSEVIEGSKNAGHIISMPDEAADTRLRRIASKLFCLEYFDRPELPDEAFEDYMKMIVYTGALSVIEANAPYVATRMMLEGMGNYMMVRDENGIITKWSRYMGLPDEKKTYQLIRITSNNQGQRELLEMMVRLIKNYIEAKPAGEKDYGKTLKSERLLRQYMDFDPDNTKIFDLHMSSGYALIALETYVEYLLNLPDTWEIERGMSRILSALRN